ncbi:MAG: hypothetical protein AAFQ95_17820 [Cyanobacteria bacterium J06621_3]
MLRGLLWLPLLGVFFGLAWAGWNEYQKLEAYKTWATQFERAKYDIYAALGQQGDQLTWGMPTRQGVINTETLDLTSVKQLDITVDGNPIRADQLPHKGRFSLAFTLDDGRQASIPFTDGDIAQRWLAFICNTWNLPSTTPSPIPSSPTH